MRRPDRIEDRLVIAVEVGLPGRMGQRQSRDREATQALPVPLE